MFKPIALTVVLFSSILVSVAQPNLDSLHAVWKDNSALDSVRTEAFKVYIYKGYLYSNPDTAEVLAQELLNWSVKQKYSKASSSAYLLLGTISQHKGNYPEALNYFKLSLKLKQEAKDKKGICAVLGNIGLVYKLQNEYLRALEYYQQSLKISEELKDTLSLAICKSNIGLIFQEQGDYPKALNYFEQCLKLFETIGFKQGIAASLVNIGTIYHIKNEFTNAMACYQRSLKFLEEIGNKQGSALCILNIGNVFLKQGDYQKAIEYYNQSLTIYTQIGSKDGIAQTITGIGEVYQEQGVYPEAIEQFQKSLSIFEEIGNKFGFARVLYTIGDTYKILGRYPQAIEYCERALKITIEIGTLEFEKFSCECLYETYKAMGNANAALTFHEKMSVIKDSLNSEETTKKLQQIEFDRLLIEDSLKRVVKNEELRQMRYAEVMKSENVKRQLITGGIIAILIALGFYFRWRQVKVNLDTQRRANERIAANNLQLSAALEDLRNTQAQLILVENQKNIALEKTRIARDMHDDIGSGLTQIAIMAELLKANKNQNSSAEQVKKISNTANELVQNMSQIIWAMSPENNHLGRLLGYLRKFSLDYFDESPIRCHLVFPEKDTPIQLSQAERRNLFLVIKETFHNILKHSDAQEVNFSITLENKKLKINIVDNGKGFDVSESLKMGNGLRNMSKRMAEIDGEYKIESQIGKGTFTHLEVMTN